jgi:predicted DNA-binding transcriptional regulator YafY
MKPTLDFRQELLSRGADVEVLVPLFFREEIVQAVNKMSSLYK